MSCCCYCSFIKLQLIRKTPWDLNIFLPILSAPLQKLFLLFQLTCKNNHKFEINPQKHLLGSGCRKCFTDSRRLDTDTFIARSKEIHKDLYDYSKTKYINDITEVLINCKEHGEFYQLPSVHYRSGCTKCGIIKKFGHAWA